MEKRGPGLGIYIYLAKQNKKVISSKKKMKKKKKKKLRLEVNCITAMQNIFVVVFIL